MRTEQEFSRHTYISEFPGQSLVTRYQASDDPAIRTAETIERMKAAAEKDCLSAPVMRATAIATLFCDGSEAGRVRAIHDWVASNIKFRQDEPVLSFILGFEDEEDLIIHPARLLTMQRPSGDCDCFTTLTLSMLLCADIPCEPVTIKADPRRPGRDSHTYAQAITDQGVIPTDTSQAAQHGYPVGWEPEAGVTERTPWGIMQPPQFGSGLHGYVGGLGQNADDFGGATDTGGDTSVTPPVVTQPNVAYTLNQYGEEVATTPEPTTSSSNASGINWTQLGTALGADAAKITQLATLPAGYTLNAAGQPVLASTAALSTGIASLFSNPIIWLLIGAALLIPEMEGGRR